MNCWRQGNWLHSAVFKALKDSRRRIGSNGNSRMLFIPIRAFSMYQKLPNDPYLILNVERSADLKDIKKQYFKMAKKYHPDLNPGNDYAKKMFIVVKEAYHTIEIEKDPKLKKLKEKSEKTYEKAQPERPFKSRRPVDFASMFESATPDEEDYKQSKWLKQFSMRDYKNQYMPVHYKNIDRHGLK